MARPQVKGTWENKGSFFPDNFCGVTLEKSIEKAMKKRSQ